MREIPSHEQGFRETRQARKLEASTKASQRWAEIDAENRARDERTARLRAARLAQVTVTSPKAADPIR